MQAIFFGFSLLAALLEVKLLGSSDLEATYCIDFFHPQNVPKFAKLSSDLGKRPDFFEIEALVKRIRGRVRLRNSGDNAVNIFLCKQRKQSFVQLWPMPLLTDSRLQAMLTSTAVS